MELQDVKKITIEWKWTNVNVTTTTKLESWNLASVKEGTTWPNIKDEITSSVTKIVLMDNPCYAENYWNKGWIILEDKTSRTWLKTVGIETTTIKQANDLFKSLKFVIGLKK